MSRFGPVYDYGHKYKILNNLFGRHIPAQQERPTYDELRNPWVPQRAADSRSDMVWVRTGFGAHHSVLVPNEEQLPESVDVSVCKTARLRREKTCLAPSSNRRMADNWQTAGRISGTAHINTQTAAWPQMPFNTSSCTSKNKPELFIRSGEENLVKGKLPELSHQHHPWFFPALWDATMIITLETSLGKIRNGARKITWSPEPPFWLMCLKYA